MSDQQQREYHLRIVDEHDGMLWGEVAELPGCFASGVDMDELMEAAAEAIVMYQTEAPETAPVLDLAKRRRAKKHKAIHREYEVAGASICIEA